jgi:hypothetical protein
MDDGPSEEIQIWRAHLSTYGFDVSWPGGRTEGVLVGPCHGRSRKADMCKVLHIRAYNAPHGERTYKTSSMVVQCSLGLLDAPNGHPTQL